MANKQVVTRDEFEAFLANPNGDGPLFDILRSIPEAQRQPLFDVGKSVCKIETDDAVGSGFHLGGGWIMTALHVISDVETMGAEYLSDSTFQFPAKPIIAAASRPCIFSNYRGAVAEDPLEDVVKDLALIYVPELLEPEYNTITGLVSPFQEPPEVGDRVYLIHFEQIDGEHADQTPQQFSVNGNVILGQEFNHPSGNRYSTHNTYCRCGSSGAPLLVFSDVRNFLVAGVHFAGDDEVGTGYALWFANENWLQQTLFAASTIIAGNRITGNVPKILQSQVNTNCQDMQKHLTRTCLRVIINIPRPEFLTGLFEDIIFRPQQ